jgi:hypothetical protein
MWTMDDDIWLGLTPNLGDQSALAVPSTAWRSCQQRHLWQSTNIVWIPVSRDISGSPQYCLAVLSTETSLAVHQYCLDPCQQKHLWQPPVLSDFLPSETSWERVGDGRSKQEFNLSVPVGLQEFFNVPQNLTMRDLWLYCQSEKKVCCGFLSSLKIHRLGLARTRKLWVQWRAH